MTVLMTYHKLVERDSKHVDSCWKLSAIIFLLISITCCIVGSFSLQRLTHAYDDHCVLDTKLKFEPKSNGINAALRSNTTMSTKMRALSTEQIDFLDDQIINDKLTDWGKQSSCDFAVFIPIFQCCFGIIFVVMFIICGKGGQTESSNTFLPKPWRIVMPSLVFFIIMTILSIVNLTNISKGLSTFCKSFSDELKFNISCIDAMDHFEIAYGIQLVRPSVLYILTITFSWLLMSCWLLLTLIMIARIVCVVDFQLVRVTVKTCDYESADEREKVELKVKERQDEKNLGNSSDAPLENSEC